MRTIAIGDIHGCNLALEALLRAIAPQPDDVLITLGDYIDRGPDSRGVITTLMELAGRCRLVPLIGNHEIMMLVAREDRTQMEFWLQFGGLETLDSYGGSHESLEAVPEEHFRYIDSCQSYFQTEKHIFLHANYAANTPLERQPEYLLFWEHLTSHVPDRHYSGKTTIVGHTPQYEGEILDLGHVVCIDTFCVGGGWLTALDVDTGQNWQADRDGRLRQDADTDPAR